MKHVTLQLVQAQFSFSFWPESSDILYIKQAKSTLFIFIYHYLLCSARVGALKNLPEMVICRKSLTVWKHSLSWVDDRFDTTILSVRKENKDKQLTSVQRWQNLPTNEHFIVYLLLTLKVLVGRFSKRSQASCCCLFTFFVLN